MLIGAMLSISLLDHSTLFGRGEGMGWRRVQAARTLLFEKQGLKLVLAVRKTKTKLDQGSKLFFSMIITFY